MNKVFPKDEIIVYKSVIYANLILTMGVLYGNLKIQEKNLENEKNEVTFFLHLLGLWDYYIRYYGKRVKSIIIRCIKNLYR